ncbi:MAG: FAD-binding oxidoreductase [Steroidobacteraceae bacterium]
MKRREFCKATLVGSVAAACTSAGVRAFAEDSPAPAGGDIPAVKLSGEATVIPAAAVKNLAGDLHGSLLTSSDKDYDQARRIWNKMIDRRPALVARCSGAADVARAVAFARERDLLVAVRGGGHSFPGYSVCNGGLMIDLSPMRSVVVDPIAKTARVAGGAWIGDLDWEAQQYGLATPMGEISNTGVAGLTLGGGYGWLARRYGLACDNLVSVDLISADAKFHRVSAAENPDLFWAVRGGGGNFGVVTSFEFRLHPIGQKVLAGYLSYAPAQMRAVLEHYGQFAARAPRECAVELGLGAEGFNGNPAIIVCYVGDPKMGEKVLQPLRTGVQPGEDTIAMQDYVKLQQMFDGPPLAPDNAYLKGGYVAEFTPALVDVLTNEMHTDATEGVWFHHCGGAIADVDPTATVLAHRKEMFQLLVDARWPDAADNEKNRTRVHAEWDKVKPFTSGFYVNLNSPDQKAVDDNYGPNRPRLAALKKQYDPGNLFRLNANVKPAA